MVYMRIIAYRCCYVVYLTDIFVVTEVMGGARDLNKTIRVIVKLQNSSRTETPIPLRPYSHPKTLQVGPVGLDVEHSNAEPRLLLLCINMLVAYHFYASTIVGQA